MQQVTTWCVPLTTNHVPRSSTTQTTRVITYATLRVIKTYIAKVTHYFLDGLYNLFFVVFSNTFCYDYAGKKSNI